MNTVWKAPAMQVLIRPAAEPKETASGIQLPDSQRRKVWYGEAIAVGPEAANVKVGDKVFYLVEYAKELPKDLAGEKLYSIAADVCLAAQRIETVSE